MKPRFNLDYILKRQNHEMFISVVLGIAPDAHSLNKVNKVIYIYTTSRTITKYNFLGLPELSVHQPIIHATT